MTPKQLINRINKMIKNKQLDFYTNDKPLKFDPMPTTINETIACLMNEWIVNFLYAYGMNYDESYFHTSKSYVSLQEVLQEHLHVTGISIDMRGDQGGTVTIGTPFPESEEENDVNEHTIQALIAELLLDISEGSKDFKADNKFKEYYDASRQDISARDLLDALEADEEQFSEISKDAYDEYKKYRL